MSDILKGNFTPQREVKADAEAAETLEARFEREAMKRLGGSIAFVSKRKVDWGDEAEAESAPAATATATDEPKRG